jgi:lipopolysaccharide transport system ATP-binding protein
MTQPAILVENLGKRYQIGLRRAASRTLRETLVDWAKAPWRRLRTLSGTHVDSSSFWAIRNLHFEVQPGEVLGVIGRNGAGKSTLLKLLSRISEPTEGRAVIRGRVASLLEVGTGFHHELTGRENIFLNGAILGMPRSLILRLNATRRA